MFVNLNKKSLKNEQKNLFPIFHHVENHVRLTNDSTFSGVPSFVFVLQPFKINFPALVFFSAKKSGFKKK